MFSVGTGKQYFKNFCKGCIALIFTNIVFPKFYIAHDMLVFSGMGVMCEITHMLTELTHVVWTQSLLS